MCLKPSPMPLWVLFCLVLVLLSAASLHGQSLTLPEAKPLPTRPASVLTSTDSLLLLWQKLADSRQSLTEVQQQAETAQQRASEAQTQAESAQTKAESLSLQLDQQKQDSTELSKSLAASLTKAALADQATKDREALDQKAIDASKAQNWVYAGCGALTAVALVKGYEFVVSLLKK